MVAAIKVVVEGFRVCNHRRLPEF